MTKKELKKRGLNICAAWLLKKMENMPQETVLKLEEKHGIDHIQEKSKPQGPRIIRTSSGYVWR